MAHSIPHDLACPPAEDGCCKHRQLDMCGACVPVHVHVHAHTHACFRAAGGRRHLLPPSPTSTPFPHLLPRRCMSQPHEHSCATTYSHSTAGRAVTILRHCATPLPRGCDLAATCTLTQFSAKCTWGGNSSYK
eukprot:364867-Chlamydomonas_euryale.AAC.5